MYYKYLHYTDDKSFNSLIDGTLNNPSLMFVAPETLNDPNEFKIDLVFDTSNKDKIRKRFFGESTNPTESEYNNFLSSLDNPNTVWYKKNELRYSLMQYVNICSLSKNISQIYYGVIIQIQERGFALFIKMT